MDSNFRIPNMGSVAIVGHSADRIGSIIRKMNESTQPTPEPTTISKINEAVSKCTCPQCGAEFEWDNEANDGTHPTCPACNFEINDAPQFTEGEVETEAQIEESVSQLLDEYVELVESQQYSEAKALLESNDASVSISGDEFILEATRIVVHADGSKEKKKIKRKKKRLTSAQKAALKKNRKKSQKGAAKKKRAKAMKKRKAKIHESYQIADSIKAMLEKEGFSTIDTENVRRTIREASRRSYLNESEEVVTTDDQITSAVETVLTNKGLTVVDTDVETEDGIVAVEVTVKDTDAEIYLGEVADELAGVTSCDVDYDEPESVEDDPEDPSPENGDLVDLVFYFVPSEEVAESDKEEAGNGAVEDIKKECETVVKECAVELSKDEIKECVDKAVAECEDVLSKKNEGDEATLSIKECDAIAQKVVEECVDKKINECVGKAMAECDMRTSAAKDAKAQAIKECADMVAKKNESDDSDKLTESDFEEIAKKVVENMDSDDPDKNESIKIVGGMSLNESFDKFAGGQDNVRCMINPAFIKPGQFIYDADQHTLFKALTESVHEGDEYQMTIDVLNSSDSRLAGAEGAKVSIAATGNYYLLKSNPME